jgi:hypothetical protein
MALCPICSAFRGTAQKRNSKVLAVKLVEPQFAVYYCNHCGAHGYSHPDSASRIIDLAEQQRLRKEATRHTEAEKARRRQRAIELWNDGKPCRNSPIEDYLYYTRGLGDWLDTIPHLDMVFRYHPNCPFGEERLPCMLALVREIRTDAPVAVHRTAVTLDKYPRRIGRMSLGPTGGGAIKISPDFEVHSGLLIGEGIETVLAASKVLNFKPVWSIIDKGNLAKFPILAGIETLTIAVDNDASGDGQKAAAECVKRQMEAGIEVITARTNFAKDFNDVVVGRKSA